MTHPAENDAAEMDRLWHTLFLAEYNYDADPTAPHRERRDDARSQVVRHVLRIRARAARAASTVIPHPNEALIVCQDSWNLALQAAAEEVGRNACDGSEGSCEDVKKGGLCPFDEAVQTILGLCVTPPEGCKP